MSSNDIKLSPKYGVNPTIPVCFWCGAERNEIALMGRIGNRKKNEDFEAPKHMVINYEPCDKCRQNMSQGFTMIEATEVPNSASEVEIQSGVYPTGRFVVIKREAADKLFPEASGMGKAFVGVELFNRLIHDD